MSDDPIIVHSQEDARAAFSVGAELGVPVTLRSAPGAGRYLGASVFRDMIEEAANSCPKAVFTSVFDCGEDPGLALSALRQGLKVIRVSVKAETKGRIAEIAAQTGARLDDNETSPVLDLLDQKDKEAAVRIWLAKGEK